MKILHIIDQIGREHGGSAEACRKMVDALRFRGHDVTVYASDAGMPIDQGYHLFSTGMSVRDSIRVTPGMLTASFYGFEVIHFHNYYTYQNLVGRLRGGSTPMVLQPHGTFVMYDPGFDMRGPVQKCIDPIWRGWFLERMDRVICVSDIEVKQAQQLGLTRTALIPNGIDMKEYAKLPERGEFRERYGFGDEKIILYLGRDHYLKGTDLLPDMCRDIDARLVMVGKDTPPLYNHEKLAAYVDADVVVMPSRYDVFGIVALEAMACGTPVVMSKNVGARYFLKDEVTSGKSMAESIRKVISEEQTPEKRQRRIDIAKRFDWDIIAGQIEGVYKND